MAERVVQLGDWGRKRQNLVASPLETNQQFPRGVDLAGSTVQTPQGEYQLQGASEGGVPIRQGAQLPQIPQPRQAPTVATQEQPLLKQGQTIPLPTTDQRQQEIDVMVKKAKGETLGDSDLRFLAERAIDARDAQQMAYQPTVQDIMQMSPEERMAWERQAFAEQAQQKTEGLEGFLGQQQDVYQRRIDEAQAKIEEERAKGEGANQELINAFKAEQQAAAEESKQEVTEAGAEGLNRLQRLAARRGMTRSSTTEGAIAKATQNTQKLVAAIERETNRAVREYEVELMDKLDNKIMKLEDRVTLLGDQAAQAELENIKQKQALYFDLITQSPDNPQKMAEMADKLKAQQFEELKEQNKVAQELRKEAQSNFQFMVSNFGSQAFTNVTPEEIDNLAANLGIPASVLSKLPATLKEQENAWDQLKYYDTQAFTREQQLRNQDFEASQNQMNQAFQIKRDALGFDFDIAKIQANLEKDVALEDFKSKVDQAKGAKARNAALSQLGGEYAKYATEVDPSGMTFGAPIPHVASGASVAEMNPLLAQFKPDGYRYNPPSKKSLIGQCAWYAEEITLLNGKKWNIGNSIGDKKANLAGKVKRGEAFYPGKGKIEVGQTILTNESPRWGHVAVVNAIKPDGTLVLTESNYKPLTVTNTREMKPDSKKIFGILKTKPIPQLQTKGGSKMGSALATAAGAVAPKGVANIASVIGKTLFPGAAPTQFGAAPQAPQAAPQLEDWQVKTIEGWDNQTRQEIFAERPQLAQQYYSAAQPVDKSQQFTQANQLASRYKGMQDEVRELEQGNAITRSFDVNTTNPFDDQALIFSFMKILDPGSVVREGEFNTAQRNTSTLDSLAAGWKKAITGEGMINKQQRQNILNVMNRLYNEKRGLYASQLQQAEQTGQQWGIDPSLYLTYRSQDLGSTLGSVGSLPAGVTSGGDLDFYNSL